MGSLNRPSGFKTIPRCTPGLYLFIEPSHNYSPHTINLKNPDFWSLKGHLGSLKGPIIV